MQFEALHLIRTSITDLAKHLVQQHRMYIGMFSIERMVRGRLHAAAPGRGAPTQRVVDEPRLEKARRSTFPACEIQQEVDRKIAVVFRKVSKGDKAS